MTATIIEFKPKNSTSYINLKNLFEITESIDACNFYLETVETLANMNQISEKEKFTLRRIGRQKRIALAHPEKKEAEKVSGSGTYRYTPEMGDTKPECQIEASLSWYGKHYFLKTREALKGRGITLYKTENGINFYTATRRAYDLLEAKYSISYESNLD